VSVLDDMLAALSSRYDLRDLLQRLSTVICRIVPYDEAQLVLLTKDGSPLCTQNARRRMGGSRRQGGRSGSRRYRAAGSRCRTRIGPWPAAFHNSRGRRQARRGWHSVPPARAPSRLGQRRWLERRARGSVRRSTRWRRSMRMSCNSRSWRRDRSRTLPPYHTFGGGVSDL
jgi:hypothetical protein